MSESLQWRVVFYQDSRGRIPVDDWIRELAEQDQVRIFKTIDLLKTYGLRLTLPHSRHLQGKLWELRVAAARRDYRVLYTAATGRRFVLLHGFAKKTPKTPPREMEIAERRLADYLQRIKGESAP